MKKLLKFLLFLVVIIGGIGYAVYYFGSNIATEKLSDIVSQELENSGQMEEMKQYIESDATLKQYVQEAESIDEATLPFTTKEEGIELIVQKVGIVELMDIQGKVEAGTLTQEEVIQLLETKLTKEEIDAIKVIAYKEIYR